ncbi:transporter substrate-binding domain-containing protein [Clostridium sp. DJ247]|uniref:transporter substrate-binding domain-containing protein n=1 Tax=Clostridium sp. DJ247 TaxID=2726188 RepID=UPI0016238A5B|nr:transporter substrate-binding domain-containing protein [Clostridium sp. DJ247]MBC2580870.1 transporter substrate-binding domain-containing protein [Clostridium sp. DJ247]
MLKKTLKKLIAFSLVVGTLATFTGCGNKNNGGNTAQNNSQSEVMQRIKKNGKLVIGTSADYPPYEFHKSINGKDEIVGFDIEIAQQIAKDLGVQLEKKDMKFDGLLAALNEGKVDMVISGMTPTPERAKNVDFSNVYYTAVQTIVVRTADKDKIKSTNDLNGKKIGVQKGSIQEDIAKEQVSGAQAIALGKISDLMLALKSNRIEAAIVESPVAVSNINANKDLVISDIKLNTEEAGSAVAIKKGTPDLVQEVNKTLDKLKKDKSIDKFVTDATNLVE